MNARIFGFALAFLVCTAAHGESMRCGQFVVDEAATIAELLTKCGEPTSKNATTEDVFARNRDTGHTYKVGTKITERWLYQRSNRALPMTVTIIDGKIVRLERAD